MAEVIIINTSEKQFALSRDLHDFLERKKHESTSYSYQVQKNCQPDVDFYEWSNIMGEPKKFRFLRELIPFLDDSKIIYTEEQIESLKSSYTKRYAACREGTNELQLAYSIDMLKTYIKKDNDTLDYNCKTKVEERKKNKSIINVPCVVPNGGGNPLYHESEYPNDEYGWWD